MKSSLAASICVIALWGGAAYGKSADLLCTRADGAGSFHFIIDYDAGKVDVGRYKAIPASIGAQTISFKYNLGQLWGKMDTPEYDVTFDRASGNFLSHTPAGADRDGRRWIAGDARSSCR